MQESVKWKGKEGRSGDCAGKGESFDGGEEKEDSCEQAAMTEGNCGGKKGLNPGKGLEDRGRGPAPALFYLGEQ